MVFLRGMQERQLAKSMLELRREYDSRAGEKWEAAREERTEKLAAAIDMVNGNPSLMRRARRYSMCVGISWLVTMFAAPAVIVGVVSFMSSSNPVQHVSIYIGGVMLLAGIMFWRLNGLLDRAVKWAVRRSGNIADVSSGAMFEISVPGKATEDELAERAPFSGMDDGFLLYAHARQLSKRRKSYVVVAMEGLLLVVCGMVMLMNMPAENMTAMGIGIAGLMSGGLLLSMEAAGWLLFKNDFYGYGQYMSMSKMMPDFGVTGMEMELARRGIDWRRMS